MKLQMSAVVVWEKEVGSKVEQSPADVPVAHLRI